MPKCPRCGATNIGARDTCWNCWTKLASVSNVTSTPNPKTQVWVKPKSNAPAVQENIPKVKTAFHFPTIARKKELIEDSINCPHCSATNNATRDRCWSCWAGLRPIEIPKQKIYEEVSPSIALEQPVGPPLTLPEPEIIRPEALVIEEPLAIASVIEVEITAEQLPVVFELPEEFLPVPVMEIVMEPLPLPEVIPAAEEIAAPIEEIATELEVFPAVEEIAAPIEEIAAVVETEEIDTEIEESEVAVALPEAIPIAKVDVVVSQTSTPAIWYAVLPVALAMLVLGAMLCWNMILQPRVNVVQITRITQTYLSALEQGDINTQTHLATQASKGRRLPAWITVGGATLHNPKNVQVDMASYDVTLYLIPSEEKAEQIAALQKALSRQYQLGIVLRYDDGEWLVDQQQLALDLRERLTAENPGITFPKW